MDIEFENGLFFEIDKEKTKAKTITLLARDETGNMMYLGEDDINDQEKVTILVPIDVNLDYATIYIEFENEEYYVEKEITKEDLEGTFKIDLTDVDRKI